MKTKSDYALLLFLLANSDEHELFAKQEAQKILEKKKIVLKKDEETSVISSQAAKKLKKHFGIKFEEEK